MRPTILLSSLLAATVAGASTSAQGAHPLDAALGLTQSSSKAAKTPPAVELRGKARALWRTSESRSPIADGTFVLRRDALGGVQLAIELAPLGRVEYAADAVTAWYDHPERGIAMHERKAGAPIRRLLAALTGDARWRLLYEEAAPAEAGAGGDDENAAHRFSMGGRDQWVIDANHRLIGAVVYLGASDSKPSSMRITRANFSADDELPRQITIDHEHHRYELRVAEVRRGDRADRKPVHPTEEQVSRLAAATEKRSSDETAIQLVTRAEIHLASITKTVKMAEISKELGQMMPAIMFALKQQRVQPIGAPLTRYHEMRGAEARIEVGFPVASPIEAVGDIRPSTLPAGRAATTWHIGPYQKLGQSHGRLNAWIAKNGLRASGGPWEVYWTDPGLEPDPTKWRTQLIAPVANRR